MAASTIFRWHKLFLRNDGGGVMEVSADYVTERESAAIRGVPFIKWQYDPCHMVFEFTDAQGWITVPHDIVMQYLSDWRLSGLRSLKGNKQASLAQTNGKG